MAVDPRHCRPGPPQHKAQQLRPTFASTLLRQCSRSVLLGAADSGSHWFIVQCRTIWQCVHFSGCSEPKRNCRWFWGKCGVCCLAVSVSLCGRCWLHSLNWKMWRHRLVWWLWGHWFSRCHMTLLHRLRRMWRFLGFWGGWWRMCRRLLSAWLILSLWPWLRVPGLRSCEVLCSGVVRQEWPLRCTGPHGPVGVHQQVGEAGSEVRDEVVGNRAQSLLDLSRQLSVMVFLWGQSAIKSWQSKTVLNQYQATRKKLLPCSSLHVTGLWLTHPYRTEISADLPKKKSEKPFGIKDKKNCWALINKRQFKSSQVYFYTMKLQ